MTTYRKKLLDKDGNTIIPALAGDETGWVNTADLADGSVISDKLADSAVTTAKIADGAVTAQKIDWSDVRVSASTIWTGKLYQISDYIDLDEPLLQGNIYIFTVFGNSDSYLMEFPMTYRNPYFQYSYYDGTTAVRWRFGISNNGTRITINNNSLNMGSNTALTRIAKVVASKRS